MPHIAMALGTQKRLARLGKARKINLMNHLRVAISARLFHLLSIPIGHLDRFVEITSCERIRMQKAIYGLAFEFSVNGGWIGVAVVALRYCVVTRLEPRIVVLLHDMTVGAYL